MEYNYTAVEGFEKNDLWFVVLLRCQDFETQSVVLVFLILHHNGSGSGLQCTWQSFWAPACHS